MYQRMTDITVVSATNRKNSLAAQVADYYAELLHQHGCNSHVLKLTELPNDFVMSSLYENRGKNPAFNQLKETMEVAQKYAFVIPEYNGSFPGVFKAFIDGLELPNTFRGKKCAMVGVSKGLQGGSFAMSHLTDIFHYLGMHVYPLKPRLSNVYDSQLRTISANEQYIHMLKEQIKGFLDY